jgi:hypothetical protein
MQLQVDIDDDAAPNLCFENASSNIRHLGKTDHLRRLSELLEIKVASQTRPGFDPDGLRCVHGVDAWRA